MRRCEFKGKAHCTFSARGENKYAAKSDRRFCHNCQTEWNYPEKVECGEKLPVPLIDFRASSEFVLSSESTSSSVREMIKFPDGH